MKNGDRPAVRTVAAGLALAAYVLISHYASSLPPEDGSRFAVIALLPYLAAAAVLAWRSRHRYAWLLACAALAALAWRHLDAIGDHAVWVYFIQHAGGNAILALIFGRSLVGNRVPLCSRIAAITHVSLEPRLARYTRRVTLAWTIFFAANACLSALLFAYAPIVLWSVFANLLDIPLVALMFAVEYVVRLRLLPDIEHIPIFDGIRLYFRLGRASPPPTA
ncbi:MAG: hypothetical protein GZ089_00585 [Aromatoleum sp.]|nr:hypothetical protein [Aromatoleum sp.]